MENTEAVSNMEPPADENAIESSPAEVAAPADGGGFSRQANVILVVGNIFLNNIL